MILGSTVVATDLVENLEAHGALAGQDVGVVVPVDVHEAALGRDLEGVCPALTDVLAVDDHVGAVLLAVLHLHTGSVLLVWAHYRGHLHDGGHYGHHHRHGDVQLAAVVSQGLGGVP